MTLKNHFDQYEIGDKMVYIVDDHHKALAAWAIERRKLGISPYLLTIDHHTDTNQAFQNHACMVAQEGRSVDENALIAKLISSINWCDDKSINEAIDKLCHDEHIHAATKSGILAASFSIQLSDQGGHSDYENSIYVVPHKCAIRCQKNVYDDECAIHHALEIIEAPYLDDQLVRISKITQILGLPSIESLPYILDIDLDAFHSIKAINPTDASTFHRLTRSALAITIATESECVEEVWKDKDNEPSTDRLLKTLINHIKSSNGVTLSPERS